MERNNEILNELQSISPLIAAIRKVNVFSVPEGYFDSISNTVMLSLHEDFSVDNSQDFSKNTDVPAGYFDTLSDSILDKIKKTGSRRVAPNFLNYKKRSVVPGTW